MSQAEDLLNSIDEEQISTYTTDSATEEHIIIGADRFIKVPEPLKRLAVQYDHNVETVTFDCPRYWDEHDLSTMYIYINYIRQDGVKGAYLAKNLVVDELDINLIHFDWTISQEISLVEGQISFLVCAIKTNSEGFQEIHWNSEINTEMVISKGLEAEEVILQEYPDIINDLLTRMDQILIGDGTVIDTSLTSPGVAADAATVGERFNEVNSRIDNTNSEIERLDNEVVKEEVDPTVPDWAKQPEKPTYSHDELIDGELLALKNGELQINLNSEMVNGQTIEHINDLINKYNVPTVSKMYDTYNYLSLDNKIKDYYENMRVLIDLTENTTEYFSSSIIPILESPSTPVNGFYYTHGDKTEYNVNTNLIFDKNDSTSGKVSKSGISLYFPIGIKNFNIKFYSEYNEDTSSAPKHGYYILKLYGRLKSSDNFILLKTENYSETKEINLLIDDDKIYDAIELVFSNETAPGLTVVARTIYTIDITTGYQERFKNGLQSYININNLGNKLIKDAIEEGKKYELVYDGTMFSAREVV